MTLKLMIKHKNFKKTCVHEPAFLNQDITDNKKTTA